ncbi:hypothetical protein DPMN_037300 [Dreissena polymorpha]|uniref:Uncharacterized protein n=1 Tax=Dreissena polymorpha TaxID=45954 RepID=A0A9D4ME87_DREPO|nr:hypothetical protein DPMN_037300 [Dreissena polymorpha]
MAINDGLQTVATILHTFSVTDSDDAVNCSVRAPQNARFEVVLATSPGCLSSNFNVAKVAKQK